MERLCSKNPYRWQISSVSKKESWLYNKWYQVWQINNIFDWVSLVKLNFWSNKLFSPNKTLIRKQKKNIFGILSILIWSVCTGEVVYIIIHLHLVFQFDRINSLSGNFYLSSLVDFSALKDLNGNNWQVTFFYRNGIKVGPTFSSLNPFLSIPSIVTGERKNRQWIVNYKTRPLIFGIQLVQRHVLA